MAEVKHKSVTLLVCLLYTLDLKIRREVNNYEDKQILDQALFELIKSGQLPDWFCEDFSYDSLYGTLNGLSTALATAQRDFMLEYETRGGRLLRKFVMGQNEVNHILERVGVNRSDARRWADQLGCLLVEAELADAASRVT